MTREQLEKRWLDLTRRELPAVALERGWPVHLDHCFQRILLDNACGRPWREVIAPPAYRNADQTILTEAVRLGQAALAGDGDLAAMNRRSLKLRGKLRA